MSIRRSILDYTTHLKFENGINVKVPLKIQRIKMIAKKTKKKLFQFHNFLKLIVARL